ncbi:MAG: FRG domain-containing protein [Ruminiclostridium sp.]|nr:FRG domain-containing protein [Ruminiclostridium sp.]
MIETVYIDSIDGIMKLISEQKYNAEIRRVRSPYFYRGMPDANYKLTTSLRLNCKHLHKELESAVLRNFNKYACIGDPSLSNSIWKQMMIGQHHGLPTRLMDWTYSPLIALHFAHTENNFNKLEKRDCVVWRLDMQAANKNLPRRYRDALKKQGSFVFSVDTLTQIVDSIEQYDIDMGAEAFVNIEPPSVDQRIINQYSFFSIIPAGIEDIEDFLDKHTDNTVKYIIDRKIRWQVRDMLDQFNISERILYPGLDGLSRSLARHYFVRNDNDITENTQ